MYEKFIVVGKNFHLVVNALKDQVCYNSVNNTFSRFDKINIFRTDYSIDRTVMTKSYVYTFPDSTEHTDNFVFEHGCSNNITVSDKISYECILRFVINIFFNRISSYCISWRSFKSNAPSGSSRRRTFGSFTIARAIAIRCC